MPLNKLVRLILKLCIAVNYQSAGAHTKSQAILIKITAAMDV